MTDPVLGPAQARVIVFFDGQNLFGAAKELYGYKVASYDPMSLARYATRWAGGRLEQARFYTGVHTAQENKVLQSWWHSKLYRIQASGVHTETRNLAYHREPITHPDGSVSVRKVPREKGIDVRIALDMVRSARERAADVIVVFSQDHDLKEAITEVKLIAQSQTRFLRLISAFPKADIASPKGRQRGIDGTDWLAIPRVDYDACLDPHSSFATAPTAFGATLTAALAKASP